MKETSQRKEREQTLRRRIALKVACLRFKTRQIEEAKQAIEDLPRLEKELQETRAGLAYDRATLDREFLSERGQKTDRIARIKDTLATLEKELLRLTTAETDAKGRQARRSAR